MYRNVCMRCISGFPLYFGIEIQGPLKDPEVAFSNQFSMEVYGMDSITAIFNMFL